MVQALLELALDVEALGCLDVLEVDAAQRRLQRRDDLDQLVRILLVELDVEHVDAGELAEQAPLALHHRLARQRPDVPQAEHRGAVGHHADQVAARGVLGGQRRVVLDRQARIGHPGGIGQRQVPLVRQRLGRHHGDLAARGRAVVLERGVPQRLLGR